MKVIYESFTEDQILIMIFQENVTTWYNYGTGIVYTN